MFPADEYFTIRNLAQSNSGESICLSVGSGKEWKSVFMVECSEIPSVDEKFKFDSKGKLRSQRFQNYCISPKGGEIKNNSELQMMNCKMVKNSWLTLRDGRITISGSNLGLTINPESDNKIPFLFDILEGKNGQSWNYEIVA